MANDITIDLSTIPLSIIRTAFDRWIVGHQWQGKTHAVGMLAAAIKNGRITLSDVRGVTPVTYAANAVHPDAFDVALRPVAQVADNASATALDALTKTRLLEDNARSLQQQIGNLSVGLTDVHDAVQQSIKAQDALTGEVQAFISKPLVDDAKVTQAVTDAVAAAFKPFNAAVVAAGAQAAVGSMVSVTQTGQDWSSSVFGVQVTNLAGAELKVDLFNDSSAPTIDPCFVWSKPILQHLLVSQATGENCWLYGEKGTGKSETVRQFAARTGRGYCRINFNKYTTAEDFVGAVGLENGATVFKMGDFLKAFTTPATLILLDEITNADPAALAILNGFLESNSAVNYGGQTWRRAPNVLVFAADNTATNGDESGRYAGTRTMNSALADRFARLVQFKHMPLATEVEAVVLHTGCTTALADHVLRAVHACREKVESGDIVDAPSIRSVMAFIRSVAVLGVDEAWAASIAHRQPSESAVAIASIKAAYIDPAFIQRNI
jgi:cobaltochelatase CobS